MGWQPGETVLGLYEVKDVRSGGMGVVHRVRHLGWQVDLDGWVHFAPATPG